MKKRHLYYGNPNVKETNPKKVWVVIKMEIDDRTLMDYASLIGVYDSFEKAEAMGKRIEAKLREDDINDSAWVEVIETEIQ